MSSEDVESKLSQTNSIRSSSLLSVKPPRRKTRRKTAMTVTVKTKRKSIQPQPDPTRHAPVLDFSFLCLASAQDTFIEVPRMYRRLRRPTKQNGKYQSAALCLGNNALADLTGLPQVVEGLLVAPYMLAWLDISFNMIHSIYTELMLFPNLQIVYLHGNVIHEITQVARLKQLPKLKTLTLHGNPIEDENGYRMVVVYLLPTVSHLDFSLVTRADKAMAAHSARPVWKGHQEAAKKKKIAEALEMEQEAEVKRNAEEAEAIAEASARERS